MAEWVQRQHSKGEIDRAGDRLANWWNGPEARVYDGFIADSRVMQNWRASHAMPLLTFRMNLTKRARRVDPDVLIAQRMKRLLSIMNKLGREPNMKLSQMQDLGGCRAIMANVESVERVFDLYRGDAPGDLFGTEGALKCYDYLKSPKQDGYRGIHVVGRYRAVISHNEPWNGHRIEIQIRSRLQHAFSTAVETVTTFTRHPLKFGGGPTDWRRFFSLMGSALAMREGTALVEGTPHDRAELIKELREASRELKVRQRLKGWTDALRLVRRKGAGKFNWLLLVLDTKAGTIKATGYEDRKKADESVSALEVEKNKDIDAVLVWVKSAKDLRAAYPNYYADTREFIKALNEALHALD
jgi:hypothetical protein